MKCIIIRIFATQSIRQDKIMYYIIILIVSILVVAVMGYYIMRLTTERDVQKSNAENYLHQLETQKTEAQKQLDTQKTVYEQQVDALKDSFEKQ